MKQKKKNTTDIEEDNYFRFSGGVVFKKIKEDVFSVVIRLLEKDGESIGDKDYRISPEDWKQLTREKIPPEELAPILQREFSRALGGTNDKAK